MVTEREGEANPVEKKPKIRQKPNAFMKLS